MFGARSAHRPSRVGAVTRWSLVRRGYTILAVVGAFENVMPLPTTVSSRSSVNSSHSASGTGKGISVVHLYPSPDWARQSVSTSAEIVRSSNERFATKASRSWLYSSAWSSTSRGRWPPTYWRQKGRRKLSLSLLGEET